jgi:gluconolactonase
MSKLERVVENCGLGEGPHWDVATQTLYLVDIVEKSILKYTPETGKVAKASVAPNQTTFIVPIEGKKNQFIISLDDQLAIISWDGESDKVSVVEKLCVASCSNNKSSNGKFNDAKCDSSGRLWAGTHVLGPDIEKTEPLGTLYTFDNKRQLKGQVDKIKIANGLAFNDKTKKMFYIDSLKGTVDQFDFDITTGSVSNRKEWFTLQKLSIPGIPDGMTIDSDGNLWVAVFGGSRVLKVDGSKSETLLDTIDIPAEQVTSVAFGGKNLDELYVTTGAMELQGKKPAPPVDGAVYKVTGTGSKGLPAVNFKL